MKAEFESRVGPYRLVRALAERVSGTLYRARRSEDPARDEVTLEVVRPECDHRDLAERARGVRPTLEGLRHPSIVALQDAQRTSSGGTYFVMGAVDGLPLVEYVHRHRLELRQRVAMVQGVCHALQYAHAHGVCHGSLSAQDVLVSAEGMPKVVGIGIPSAGREESRSAAAVERDDLCALGRLTRRVVTGDDANERLAAWDQAPEDLRAVVVTALGERPGRKYAGVEHLARDLSRVQRGRPVFAREDSLYTRAVKVLRRRLAR